MKTKIYISCCLIIIVCMANTSMCFEAPCVAYARLTEFRPYKQKPGFPEPPEATLDIGIFEVMKVVRGNIDTPHVNVIFSSNTLRGVLPTNAILIIAHNKGTMANYDPIGCEAWRGILPDTPDNRANIEALTDEELSRTPTGHEITEATARKIALSKLESIQNYTGFSGKYKFTTAEREPFGWSFYVHVLDERKSPASVNGVMVQISDDGEVVTCRINGFDSSWVANEWDSIPEL